MKNLTVRCVAVLLYEVLLLLNYVSAVDKGYFWQISDLHFDPKYSVKGDVGKLCHQHGFHPFGTKNTTAPGEFGDPKCDSPWSLVQSAITAMKTIHSNPDFVLWTGDTGPHSDSISESELNSLIKETTDLINKTFNGSSVLPVLGNHDVVPSDQMPPDNPKYYQGILKDWGWEKILSADEQKTFLKGGYYTRMITPEFSLVVLNTNLHFMYDKLTLNMIDPAGMFDWLRQLLSEQQHDNRKVMIVSHVPPGAYERVAHSFHMYPRYNREYLEVIQTYSGVIGSQVFAHEHKDTFRIFYDKNGKPINVGILAPAVNPWKNTYIPPDPPNNPGIRLVTYDRDNGNILDIEQYYMDLTAANKAGKDEWKLEYQFTKAMGVPDLKPDSLQALVNNNFSKSGDKLFDTFYSWNTALYSNASCDATCKKIYLCTIQNINITKYNACVAAEEKPSSVPSWSRVSEVPDILSRIIQTTVPSEIEGGNISKHHPHHRPTRHPPHHPYHLPKYFMFIMIGMGILVFILFLVIMLLCIRRRLLYPQTRYLRVPQVTIQ